MRFKNCTMGYIKNIYLKKMIAVENNDQDTLTQLNYEFPEIFNAQFLMDVLRNEFERARNNLDDNMIFKNYLFQYH